MKKLLPLAVCSLVLAACSKDPDTQPEPDPQPQTGEVVRVELTPSAALLEPGEELALILRAFDADGREIQLPEFTVELTDANVVGQDGLNFTGTELGSTRVRVVADEFVAETFILVADVAEGVQPIADEAVVSEPSDAELVDNVLRYKVVVDPAFVGAVGDIVLAVESAPIMGRILERRDVSEGSELTIELVPLPEIFDALEVQEHGEVGPEHTVVPEHVAEFFDVSAEDDGSYLFTPKSTALRPNALATEWTWGFFDCKAEAEFPYGGLGDFSPRVTRQLTFNLDYSGFTLKRFSVDGTMTVEAKLNPKLTAAVEAKATCDAELLRVQFPIGGPLSLIFGAGVPLGVGFEIGGKITVANLEMNFDGRVGARAEVGFECANETCEPIHVVDSIAEASAKFTLPDNSQTRIEPSISVYGITGLVVGPTFLEQLGMDVLHAQGGPVVSGNFSPFRFQAEDLEYASSYDLQLSGKVSLGSKLDWLATALKYEFGKNELDASTVLAQSPTGTYSLPTTWTLEREIELTANLSNVRFLDVEDVEGVELWDVTPNRQPERLARVERTTDGQTEYIIRHTPDTVLVGGQEDRTIAVGVDTVFSPVLIEIGQATPIVVRDAVRCDGQLMEIEPQSQTLSVLSPTPVPVTYTMNGNMEVEWNSEWDQQTATSFTIETPGTSVGVPKRTSKIRAHCPSDYSSFVEADLIVEGPDWLTSCWVKDPNEVDYWRGVGGRIVGNSAFEDDPDEFETCMGNDATTGYYSFSGGLWLSDAGTWYPEVSAVAGTKGVSPDVEIQTTSWSKTQVTVDTTGADPEFGVKISVDANGSGELEERHDCPDIGQRTWNWTVSGGTRECDTP